MIVVGCGSEMIDPPSWTEGDRPPGYPPTDDEAPSAPSKTAAATPVLDPVDPVACSDRLALRGVASPGASVFVEGGAQASEIVSAHPQTGRFCVDVALKPGQLNRITIRAHDEHHGLSEPAGVQVTQAECPGREPAGQPTEPAEAPVNVAIGAEISSKDAPKEHQLTDIVDGDDSTWAEIQGGGTWAWSNYDGWVSLKLAALTEISKIVIRWTERDGDGNRYGTKFKVRISVVAEPGEPTDDNPLWQDVAEEDSGAGGEDLFDLAVKRLMVRHVALRLLQDARGNVAENTCIHVPFVSSGCYDERFRISELQVWDAPAAKATDTTVAGTCAAGPAI